MNATIGILVNRSAPLESYNIPSWEGPDILVFDRRGIRWKEKAITGFLLHNQVWTERSCPFPGAVYNRRYTTGQTLVNRLERVIGKGKVFNCITHLNKWTVYSMLQGSSVQDHLPQTWVFDPNLLPELLEQNTNLIIKPSLGTKGRKVYRIEKRRDGMFCFYFNLNLANYITKDKEAFFAYFNPLTKEADFLVQQFISLLQVNKRTHELRMYVQKDKKGEWTVVDGFCKISYPYAYISNFYSQLRGIPEVVAEGRLLTQALYRQISEICLNTARELEKKLGHLGEISVDLGLDTSKKPWIIEVNGRTQKELLYQIKGTPPFPEVFLNPLEYAAFLTRKG